MISRRRFLQVGLAGAAVLAAARLLQSPGTASGRLALSDADARIVAALAPALLADALPPEADARARAVQAVVGDFDRAVAGLEPAAREEVGQLLGLLRFAPSRWALAGIAAPLDVASEAEVAAFLARWRASRFDLLRAGYQALAQLVRAAWYGNPDAWAAIGYPGPPALGAR